MIWLIFLLSIDLRYHTFNEVAYELDSIAYHYSTIARLDTIGYSSFDSLPIFALKISDDVAIDEDEIAILYIGCHHAEEILGVEICMYMINDLISNYEIDSARTHWINNREIWFVPLLNPEGHTVVMSGIDTTWRKNKRDNNKNGIFELEYDGVDINRNYDFYWNRGGNSDPASEYYRGSAPFSENETKAIRDLCLSENFVFCITYHSARTGLGEVVYYPWREGDYFPPDFQFIRGIADTLSKKIIKDQGIGHYMALVGVGLDGRARNWLYGVCGIFAYCIEVSTTTIQPGWMVNSICQRNLVGAYYLLERITLSGITGCVYDSLTNQPLCAEVLIEGYYDVQLPPRMTNSSFGRFTRITLPGTYNIEIRKDGYESKYYQNIVVEPDRLTELNVYLKRLTSNSPREKNDNSFFINPNPTKGTLYINFDSKLNLTALKIYDNVGRLLATFENPQNFFVWQLRDKFNRQISNGVYWLVGETTEEKFITKMIVVDR